MGGLSHRPRRRGLSARSRGSNAPSFSFPRPAMANPIRSSFAASKGSAKRRSRDLRTRRLRQASTPCPMRSSVGVTEAGCTHDRQRSEGGQKPALQMGQHHAWEHQGHPDAGAAMTGDRAATGAVASFTRLASQPVPVLRDAALTLDLELLFLQNLLPHLAIAEHRKENCAAKHVSGEGRHEEPQPMRHGR